MSSGHIHAVARQNLLLESIPLCELAAFCVSACPVTDFHIGSVTNAAVDTGVPVPFEVLLPMFCVNAQRPSAGSLAMLFSIF